MNVFLYLLALFLYIGGQDAFSYEVTTHAAITKRAVENFVNAHPNKLGNLGVFSFVDTINTDGAVGARSSEVAIDPGSCCCVERHP